MVKKLEKILLGLYIFLFLVTATILIIFFIDPSIILLKGDLEISLNEEYKEPGYIVKPTIYKLDKKVKISNNINNKEYGTYNVEYTLKYFNRIIKKTRKVSVIDTEPPIINLKGNIETNICPNQKYQEEGYTAVDNLEGDITESVRREEKNNKIIYTVKDNFNNEAKSERNLKEVDEESPNLELLGSNPMYVYLNEKYIEPGYNVSDNCSNNLKEKVEIENNINTSQTGTYKVTYKIKDDFGNTTEKERKIYVIKKIEDTGVAINKSIYLTFDDGPSRTITASVLNILKEENVQATFFVINHDDSLNYLIKKEYDEGHTVALHSYTHNYKKIYASSEAYFTDLNQIREKVKNITGEYSNIIRFPGGSSNKVSSFNPGIMTSLSNQVLVKGYRYFDWNVSSGDAGGAKTKEEVYNNVVKNLKKGQNVVLMHDYENNYITLNALKDIIRYAKNNGYTFYKITDKTAQIHHKIAN